MGLSPGERLPLVRDGLLAGEPLFCEDCGRPLEANQLVLCEDGYERVYGEFVLVPDSGDDPRESNCPVAHAACAREADGGPTERDPALENAYESAAWFFQR